MKKKCPKCGNKIFEVTAHVTQEWQVDEDGDFLGLISECEMVTHAPDDNDLWQCSKCGYQSTGEDFNVKDEEEESEAHANPDISLYKNTLCYVHEKITDNIRCRKCGSIVLKTELTDEYKFQCLNCDEDLYAMETYEGEKFTPSEFAETVAQAANIFNLDK